MPRGPRSPQGIARVTATIERINALGLNRRRGPGKREPDRVANLRRREVRALVAQIVAVIEGEGRRISNPTDRVMIELLATALALTCLAQDPDLAASRATSVTHGRSPAAQETGEVASVRGDAPGRER